MMHGSNYYHQLLSQHHQLILGSLVAGIATVVTILRTTTTRSKTHGPMLPQQHQQQRHASNNNGASNANGAKRFHLYMNPLCPFVQRARIIISELQATDLITYTPIPLRADLARAKYLKEIPSWGRAIGVNTLTEMQQLKEWFMMNINKTGEVPALIDTSASDPNMVIKESDVVSEYLYLTLNNTRGVELDLFPSASYLPEEVIRFRFALKTFPSSSFYAALRNQDPQKDAEVFKSVRDGLSQFLSHMSSTGPFYIGHRYTFADIFAVPHIARFSLLLKYYRGFDIFTPCQEYDAKRFKSWFIAVSSKPSVQRTTPTADEIIEFYEGEANDNQLSENGFYGRGRSHL